MTSIPLRTLPVEPHAGHYDAPYRQFIAASLVLGTGGGFLLSILLPLARTLNWGWGASARWTELVQVHGQLQLVGFAGLFVIGMALRLMPRVSGRPLACTWLVPAIIPAVAASLVLRALSQPLPDSPFRDASLLGSAGLFLAATAAFAAIVWTTLLRPDSKAGPTGYFFLLGATGLAASAVINGFQMYEMVRDSLTTAPAARQSAQLFVQQFGFVIVFLAGVGSRAIPTLTGQPRREVAPRIAAAAFGIGVTLFAAYALIAAEQRPTVTLVRVGDAGLLSCGLGLAMMVWISGALSPSSRVAAASRAQFWFVRSAFAWMAVSTALIVWYGGRAFVDGRPVDQFEFDAIRHVLTLGVITMMVVGMSLLIVPEFAGRRLQHPSERWLHITMLTLLNLAVALRLWPALEGINWLEDTRYWPIAMSAPLAGAVVVAFAVMFAQSWWQQRDPSWSAGAVQSRTSPTP